MRGLENMLERLLQHYLPLLIFIVKPVTMFCFVSHLTIFSLAGYTHNPQGDSFAFIYPALTNTFLYLDLIPIPKRECSDLLHSTVRRSTMFFHLQCLLGTITDTRLIATKSGKSKLVALLVN
jgi:hypothetical protein